MPALEQSPRRVNHSSADRGILICTVLKAMGARRETHMDDEGDRGQCFSCGFFGHGVNRCPRLNRSFPYKTPRWSVDVRNGQYHASRMSGDEHDLRRGKEGWFGREGQPPGPSVTVTQCRIVLQRWWIRIQTWTCSVAQSGMGAIGLLWGTV